MLQMELFCDQMRCFMLFLLNLDLHSLQNLFCCHLILLELFGLKHLLLSNLNLSLHLSFKPCILISPECLQLHFFTQIIFLREMIFHKAENLFVFLPVFMGFVSVFLITVRKNILVTKID